MHHLREDEEAHEEQKGSPLQAHSESDMGPWLIFATRVENVLQGHAHIVCVSEAAMMKECVLGVDTCVYV